MLDKYLKECNTDEATYIKILKEINEWETVCCNNREESINELPETVYPEIVLYMVEDGYNADLVNRVMINREGHDLDEGNKLEKEFLIKQKGLEC